MLIIDRCFVQGNPARLGVHPTVGADFKRELRKVAADPSRLAVIFPKAHLSAH